MLGVVQGVGDLGERQVGRGEQLAGNLAGVRVASVPIQDNSSPSPGLDLMDPWVATGMLKVTEAGVVALQEHIPCRSR